MVEGSVTGVNFDWIWENPLLMHKDKYLEISNSIIQSVISREGSKLYAYNSLLVQIYNYLIAIRLPTTQWEVVFRGIQNSGITELRNKQISTLTIFHYRRLY